MSKPTHTVMPHNLAKALMEAGVHHFDLGGMLGGVVGDVGGLFGGVAKDFTTTNQYQAQLAPTTTSNYAPIIGATNANVGAGYAQAADVQAQQRALANALLQQSQNVGGPSVAQAELASNTGKNVANQGALMASQRGSGANAGMLARQAAMQGGAIQQNAVGQAATLQAQETLAQQQRQLALEQAAAQQQATMGGQNIQEQGLNAQLFGEAAGAQNTQNAGAIQNYGMQQGINSGAAQANANAVNKTEAGLMSGLSGGLTSGGGGGKPPVPGVATGGEIEKSGVIRPSSTMPDHFHKMASIYHPKFAAGAIDFKAGGHVPGRAEVKGDSIKNDKIPALLSAGEEVLPRSVTQAPNAPEKAADFVRHLQEKKSGKTSGYKPVKHSEKSLKERVQRLEKLCMGGYA